MRRAFSQSEDSDIYESARRYLEGAKRGKPDEEACRAFLMKLNGLLETAQQPQQLDFIINEVQARAEHLKYLQRVVDGRETEIKRGKGEYSGVMLYRALLVRAHKYGGLNLAKLIIIATTPRKLYSLRPSIDAIHERVRELGRILCSIDTPPTFFDRLTHKTQKRWSSSGEIIEETLEDIGLSQEAVGWVASAKKLAAQGSQPQALEGISDIDILRLLCWMLPRENAWEPGVDKTTRDLGPPLIRIARRCRVSDLQERDKCALIEAIVAVVQSNHSMADALDVAAQLLNQSGLPRYLHGLVALQKSTLYRLQSKPEKSEEVIRQYFHDTAADPQMSADDRERQAVVEDSLRRSHLENLMQQERFSLALQEARGWDFAPRCHMGHLLHPSVSITMGKIFIVHGLHASARDCFEDTLFGGPIHRVQVKGALRVNLLSRLADVYCDLMQPTRALTLLDAEIKVYNKEHRPYRKIQRLLLALVDAYLAAGRYSDALSTLCDSRLDFRKENKDMTDQFMHVRCQFARARVHCCMSRYEDGYREWDAALALVKKYPDFEDDGFAAGICHFSMAWASVELGDWDAGYEAYLEAKGFLEKSPPNYWLPTIQTTWFPYVSLQVHRKTRWAPIQQSPAKIDPA